MCKSRKASQFFCPWFYVLVYVLFYVFSTSPQPTQLSFRGCHLARRCRMDILFEGSSGDVRCSLGKHNALSYVCWVFLSYSLLMNVAYSLLLSKADTMPAEKQKQKSNCFSYCTLPHTIFLVRHSTGETIFPLLKARTVLIIPFMLTM